ncbi:activating signal cointegrator 1 complex subunit 3-like, partial [Osmerus mordax]|uniref:activating signal cointegrator 1 complex subunit 3-like n=1 Tax=Osmerus mordax TaxID=8014 RepID=UPI00350EF509
MSPPRLTGALRSFSNVSKQEDFTEEVYDLRTKRLKRQELFSRQGLTWQKIVQFCTQNLEKAELQAANQELRSILQAAKQIVGVEDGQDTIESAAVFLFQTFHNREQVGREETLAIKQMFGPFPASAADASCAAVARAVAPLGEARVEEFVRAQSPGRAAHGPAFGRNIAFSYDCYTLDQADRPPWGGGEGEEEGGGRGLDFDSFLNSHQGGGRGAGGGGAGEADGAVLREEVERYLGGGNMIASSPEELCSSLFEMLASPQSDDELQNELFELLGPEGFEMISTLLQQRASIVASLLSGPPDRASYPPDGRKGGGEASKPAYGCQVLIQSEQERLLSRLSRREEKRERRRDKRSDDPDAPDAAFCFDP